MLDRALPLAFTALSLTAVLGCAPLKPRVIDLAMSSAYRAPPPGATARGSSLHAAAIRPAEPSPYQLLAGDFHCHVQPPDSTGEVSRSVPETVELAHREKLDFVVLTPHVWSRFFEEPRLRAAVREGRAYLRNTLAALPTEGTLFLLGMEYTDHRYGHVGASLADVEAVLDELPVEESRLHPERYFERFVARGGVLTINHPLVTPLDSIVAIARADLSWRPFTSTGPFPPEIQALNGLAQGLEVFNLSATELRDRFLLGDSKHTLTATLARMDQEILHQQRRLTPLGGSDSHSHHLRATTYVLARSRDEAGIRDAVLGGRVCVRSPEACSFALRAPNEAWIGVGGSIHGAAFEARAEGEDIEILVDGTPTRAPLAGELTRIEVDPARCSVIRARVGEGYSAPIYANCSFSAPP
ncbi:MAG: hypothetical protein ABI193_06165 [Minicystis sp.]